MAHKRKADSSHHQKPPAKRQHTEHEKTLDEVERLVSSIVARADIDPANKGLRDTGLKALSKLAKLKEATSDPASKKDEVLTSIKSSLTGKEDVPIFGGYVPASKESKLPPYPVINTPELMSAVFTHRGTLDTNQNVSDSLSYERLELLGDAYIEVMATRLIWERFPDLPTGRLAGVRENLVNNETLGGFSVGYGFDKRLKLPTMITKESKAMTKIRGDIFEAYIAAIILSDPVNGFERAEEWLHKLWEDKLNDVRATPNINMKAKEELARRILVRPVKIQYKDERDPAKQGKGIMNFFIGVYFTGWGYEELHLGSGTGLNKTIAGNAAAIAAMDNQPIIDELVQKKRDHDEQAKKEKMEKEKS